MSDYGKLREQLAARDKELADLHKAYDALVAKVNELEKLTAPIEAAKQDFDRLEAKLRPTKGWFK